jgi:hypothetical protein
MISSRPQSRESPTPHHTTPFLDRMFRKRHRSQSSSSETADTSPPVSLRRRISIAHKPPRYMLPPPLQSLYKAPPRVTDLTRYSLQSSIREEDPSEPHHEHRKRRKNSLQHSFFPSSEPEKEGVMPNGKIVPNGHAHAPNGDTPNESHEPADKPVLPSLRVLFTQEMSGARAGQHQPSFTRRVS